WNSSHNSSGTSRSTIPATADSLPKHPNEMTSKQPPEKSGVAKAVDRVIAANEAHYQAHKNDFGPGAS
ncbi:hypothetical protein ACFYMW_39545, partial [Streptomyces sp. NPDC006692]|uniref:hypothetical protein n=1 Tax=Streptomyces sp. NPDC006692 TaxID=3364758 RepID=UPI00367CB71C